MNNGGYAKRLTVEIGQRFNRFIEILSEDVVEGDEVVTQGQARLIDGVQMEILNTTYEEEAAAKSNGGAIVSEDTAKKDEASLPAEKKDSADAKKSDIKK